VTFRAVVGTDGGVELGVALYKTRALSGDRSPLVRHVTPVPWQPWLSLSQGIVTFPVARQYGRADRMGSRFHARLSDSSAAL
jgi:hypothetical protein